MSAHEELTDYRTSDFDVNKSEEKSTMILTELGNLGVTISQALKDADRVSKKICNETNQYDLEYDSTLCVGKDSVRSLVELKQIATDLFADVKEDNGREFKEIFSWEPLYQDLESVERAQAKHKEFLKYLNLSLEGLQEIFSLKKREEKCGFSDSETASSTNKTDPSALGFSLFENSATNAATSSPLAKN